MHAHQNKHRSAPELPRSSQVHLLLNLSKYLAAVATARRYFFLGKILFPGKNDHLDLLRTHDKGKNHKLKPQTIISMSKNNKDKKAGAQTAAPKEAAVTSPKVQILSTLKTHTNIYIHTGGQAQRFGGRWQAKGQGKELKI